MNLSHKFHRSICHWTVLFLFSVMSIIYWSIRHSATDLQGNNSFFHVLSMALKNYIFPLRHFYLLLPQGQFEILSLSGSFLLSESGGERSRTGRLNVLLAGPDGHVLGGGVAGVLTAASAVQVLLHDFKFCVFSLNFQFWKFCCKCLVLGPS